MNDDLKTVKNQLRDIKDLVELTKRQVDAQQLYIRTTSENVRMLREQQSLMNEKLDSMDKQLNQHTEALVTIEDTIGAYGDMYKLNNDNAKKLERRVETLEDHAGIQSSPDLILSEVR